MYKLISKNVDIFNPINTIFSNRNIAPEDIEWYMNPTEFEHSPLLLNNIEGGVRSLLSHIEKESKIHVQIDKDL